MLFKFTSYLPSIIGLIVIGLAVYLKNTNARLNKMFFYLALTLAAWLLALFIGDLTINQQISLWAVRSATCVGTLIIPCMLYFSLDFPERFHEPGRLFKAFAFIPSAFFVVIALTPYLVPAVQINHLSAQPTQLGTLYSLQSLYVVSGFIVSLIILIKKLNKVTAREKAQLNLLISGLLVAALVNVITGYVLTVTKQADNYSNQAGGLSFVVFVGAAGYAIVKHRLFDVRLAITRSIAYIITIGLVAAVYSLIILIIGFPTINSGHLTFNNNFLQLLWLTPPTIFVALTFNKLKQYITRITNRIFYQDSYDTRVVLDELSDVLISENEISEIVNKSMQIINSAIKPSDSVLIVLDEKNEVYHQRLVNRHSPKNLDKLIKESLQLSERGVLVKDELPSKNWLTIMKNDDISLILRLGTKNNLAGLYLCGPKQNGRIYNQQDIDFMSVGAKNLGIALENAKKFNQISKFADTMRQEVVKATVGLRLANKELKTLDVLKDDFISMTSHQLRSPATSVHEAIKMLESDILSRSERSQILQLAEASSERLVGVIQDMLSVAKIQAGHFVLEKTNEDLVKLVDKGILEALSQANQKNINLVFTKPKKSPTLLADRAKLNESISNYIENAIKYSPSGSTVSIELKNIDDKVHFEVSDNGIGVPLKERSDLFTKFYRAKNARHEEPNGNGIGLFVVKEVIEAHGGEAYYQPLEQGSLFGFWLHD